MYMYLKNKGVNLSPRPSSVYLLVTQQIKKDTSVLILHQTESTFQEVSLSMKMKASTKKGKIKFHLNKEKLHLNPSYGPLHL